MKKQKIENYAGFLRYYFDVNTKYVVNKIRLLLFPYTKKVSSQKIQKFAN